MKPDPSWFTCFHRGSALGRAVFGLVLIAATHAAVGAEAAAGKAAFKVQCALCHTAELGDNGGAQGPSLAGVFGRRAASAPAFSYTKALRDSALQWDTETLDRFLQAPTTVVPGSSMVVPVAGSNDRQNIIAYLQTLQAEVATAPAPAGASGEQDWKKDKPGRVHRIDLAKLRAPFETPSVRNRPAFIERPAGAQPQLPAGFHFDTFASGLLGPRRMIVAGNGDVILSETQGGRIAVMRPAKDSSKAESVSVFADGLKQPFGLALYPNAKNPKWLYVAETHRIVRYAFRTGELKARGAAEIVVAELPTGGHYTRDVVFSPDGKLMYVSVGSATNVANTMEAKSPDAIRAWEAEYGLGAAWGPEANRAAVLVYEVGSSAPPKVFASGIRNCVSLTLQPKTRDLWCTTNERDLLGDDLVPDYSTRVKQGAFYGWPWYYMGEHEDPRLPGARPDLKGKITVPDVPFQAHSAALNLMFYTATSGKSAFPKEYVGDAFAVLHGSWNRAFRTGHKVVRVRMKNDLPVGEYEDFLTGFIVDDGNAWGRPVAAVTMNDGSLLLSDDAANVVYRISYSKPAKVASVTRAASLPTEIVLQGERIFPESLTSSKEGSLFFSSLGGHGVYRAAPGSASAELWVKSGAAEGLALTLGLFADDASGTLWTCARSLPGPQASSTVFALDLKTGAVKGSYPLSGEGAGCNDLTTDSKGNLYVTDSAQMLVLKLPKGGKALQVWAGASGEFGPRGGVLDGIAVLGDRVFVNTLATGKFFSIPVEKNGTPGAVAEIALDRVVERPDGMRAHGTNELIVAESGGNGKIALITLTGHSGKVTTLKEGLAGGPVSITTVGSTLYTVEGQLALRRPEATAQPGPFKATAIAWPDSSAGAR